MDELPAYRPSPASETKLITLPDVATPRARPGARCRQRARRDRHERGSEEARDKRSQEREGTQGRRREEPHKRGVRYVGPSALASEGTGEKEHGGARHVGRDFSISPAPSRRKRKNINPAVWAARSCGCGSSSASLAVMCRLPRRAGGISATVKRLARALLSAWLVAPACLHATCACSRLREASGAASACTGGNC